MTFDLAPWHTRGLRKIFVVGALLSMTLSAVATVSPSAVAHAATKQRTTSSSTMTASASAQSVTKLLANAQPGSVLTLPGCKQPPNGVDHASFTEAQLAEYGLPPRNTFATATAFATSVRGMKHRSCHVLVGSPFQKFGESYAQSSIWGGYYEYAGNWSATTVDFTLPAIQNCSSSTPGRDGIWGGIGGADGSNLVQSGTVGWCDDPYAQYSYLEYYQAWIENTGAGAPMFATDWAPTPGDHMESLVNDSPCGYMDIYDAGPGPFEGYYLSGRYGPCGGQNYFDCIEENDSYGLAQDGTVAFSECEGYDVPQSKYLVMGNSSSNYTDDTMWDGSRAYASTQSPPNTNGAGGFTITWQHRT